MQNDLISRKSLMAHFATSQALVNDRDVLYCNGVLDVIAREPSVDAVPVVRCGQCAKAKKFHNPQMGDLILCNEYRVFTDEYGFCHKGELETDKQQLEGMLTHMNQLRDAAAGRALKMEERVHQLEAERDAAVADLAHVKDCDTCKYDNAPCLSCKYEWRGVQKEE